MPITFEPLKKWYGEQKWTKYMEEQNENVDLLNEKLELLETSESVRDTNETARETAEGIRDTNETARESAEGIREENEGDRKAAELLRKSAESDRETAYGLAEEARDGLYETAEGDRDSAYGLAENARDSLYSTAEGSRNTDYGLAETARDSSYTSAEELRTTAFNTAQSDRATAFNTAQSDRATAFSTAESARTTTFNTAENTRNSNEVTRIANENARIVYEDYNPAKDYVVGNKVAYQGSSYRNKAPCKGIVPTNTTYWLLIAAKGDTGDTWKPSVSESGYLTWAKDSSGTTPTARDIKGPKGDTGDIANLTATHIANALGFTPIEYTAGTNVSISGTTISATDTKTTINGKTGVILKDDITALGIPAQDTVYTHPTTHSISEVSGLQTALDGKVDDSQVLTNVPLNAKFTDTVYSHPSSHPASMITESSTRRFVSDSEKSTWNSKSDTDTVTTINGKTGAISKADITALGIPAQDTVYSHPTSHPASMITDLPTGKKVARFVVGTSTAGWTTADCDYLCDGTADQTEINAAITALPATGGEVVILDGTYNITAKIDVTKDNVSIRGNGNATILKRIFDSTSGEGVITLTSRSGCKIANLQIDGNKTSYTNTKNYGIYLSASSSNNTITGNTCNNSYIGIYLFTSSDNTFISNTCNNSYFGIYLDTSSSNTFTDNTCNNNSYSGIYLVLASSNIITGNTCTRGTGLETDYITLQNTIWLAGEDNNYNLIAMNNCMGKAPSVDGGTGNSVYGNKYDTTDDFGNLMPISGGVLENYREKLVTLSGTSTTINLSLGNVFTHTLSGNTTYLITNAVSDQAHSFTLIITQTETVRTITFPASVKWQGGEIPDLSGASKTYVLTFLSIDGGTTWLGMFGGEF